MSSRRPEALDWSDRKVGRVVDGSGLENRRGATHRGFESLTFRQPRPPSGGRTSWGRGGIRMRSRAQADSGPSWALALRAGSPSVIPSACRTFLNYAVPRNPNEIGLGPWSSG